MPEKPKVGAAYTDGATLDVLARKHNKSIGTIRSWLMSEGVTRRHRGNPGVPIPPEEELRRLVVDQHLSDPEIGAQYNVYKAVVQRWRKKYGIPPAFSLTGPRKK